MNWKFWQKRMTDGTPDEKPRKLPKPKELHSSVGRYLVVELGKDPDWVWSLKSVTRPKEGEKGALELRIFDEAHARLQGVSVQNYESLNAHSDLILFTGWYNKINFEVSIEEKKPEPTPRAA